MFLFCFIIFFSLSWFIVTHLLQKNDFGERIAISIPLGFGLLSLALFFFLFSAFPNYSLANIICFISCFFDYSHWKKYIFLYKKKSPFSADKPLGF
ncbi:MAG: hypothetical protein CMD96_06665 [Gammaproteobacteria bacterium]|nr:hypothetical protein [Gammaproteobacteria bacterium]